MLFVAILHATNHLWYATITALQSGKKEATRVHRTLARYGISTAIAAIYVGMTLAFPAEWSIVAVSFVLTVALICAVQSVVWYYERRLSAKNSVISAIKRRLQTAQSAPESGASAQD